MSEPYVVGTSTIETPATEIWKRSVEAIQSTARTVLRDVAESQRIYRGNKLALVIAATPDGAAVPGTTMSKEQAVAYAAMIAAVATFMATEIATDFTIEDGLYAMWPPPTVTG